MKPLHFLHRSVLAVALAAALPAADAQVVINEISAASSDRLLQWTADGTPRLGSGTPWNLPTFTDAAWSSGNLPAGWGTSVSTNLQTAMLNKTPSLYLRKTFTATAAQAFSANSLVLQVDYDDGFAAYLNGVEIARLNCGAPKHFMYASQPAYNENTATGLTEITLGAAHTLLVAGTNTLAIEARNRTLNSNFRINAGLKLITSTAPITVTKAFYDMNAANNASRTHARTGATVTNTASGTAPAGSWLAAAPDPESDTLWTSLNIVTAEQVGAGVGGTGGMRYTFTQSGVNRAVAVRAPSISMVNAWSPGGLTAASLASTTLKLRYRMSGDVQFGMRFDPALLQSANSVDGFPVLGLPIGGAADYEWAAAFGGKVTMTIDASGVVARTPNGSINPAFYETSAGPGTRSGQVVLKEDNTVGAGPGGTTGILSWAFTTFPTVVDAVGFGVKALSVPQWGTTAVTEAQFASTRLRFRWKMPAGRTHAFYLESNNGGLATDRASLGTLTGTGSWETYSMSLGEIANAPALRAKLNAAYFNQLKPTKLTAFHTGAPFATGEAVEIDTVNLYFEANGAQLEEATPISFSTAADATRTRTVDAAGAASDSMTGTPVRAVTLFSNPGLTGFEFRVTEDATPGAGDGGSTGFLRCDVTDAAEAGAPWGFSLPGVTVRNWTAGAITVAQLADVTLQFAAKLPAGAAITVYAEPVGGSTANRANLGALTGNGTWQTVTREFATAGNIQALSAALNAAATTTFQLTFVGQASATAGFQLALDDVEIGLWRSYEVTLGQGANQQRFLDYLNANNLVSFIPTFVKNTAAPAGGATFRVDNLEVTYSGQDPGAFQALIAAGAGSGAWRYFVGLAEPSGGLFDPALITSGFPTPPGEEDEYESPQNFRDWVELRNLGATAVSLAGWSLTDEQDTPRKWTFPASANIPANGYLLVMCDDREEANGTATYLHASFSLSAKGEYVGLFNSAGQLQSALSSVPDQDTFHTWGRNPAGGATYGFLDTGTPGTVNIGNFTSARVGTPDFFKTDGITPLPGGFYAGGQTLVLKSETAGATLRYTTDGSDPTETTGVVYAGPISLNPPGDAKSANVIRARAFKAGLLASNTKTHSYLLNLHANLKGVPALILSGDAGRNFFLPHGVMGVQGGTSPGELWQSNGPTSYNIPINRGDPYERLVTAEWYKPDGSDGWRDEVGLRVSSSPYSRPRLLLNNTAASPWSSDHRHKPSFNLYWRDDYGTSKLTYPGLIQDNGIENYKQLRLRAGKNDILNPFLIDEVGRRLYRDMGWVGPTGTISTLYVNGSFKGFFNPTERLRGVMFKEHYRTENEFDVRYIGEAVDGDSTFWNQMQTALNTLSTNPTLANYNAVQNFLDVTNVADYFLFNIYINADDWPNNNWAAQRERSPAGRYRMVVWDVEAAFSRFGRAITAPTIDDKLLNNSTECGDIFKRLYASPEFKLLFADRIQKHMWNGGVLDDRGSNDRFQQLIDQFQPLVQPLLTYVANQTLDLNWYHNHVHPTTGRRPYLFGTAAGNFSAKGLWPATTPATMSQFGGNVAAGYQLTLTSPTGGTIYYTLDGSDPRLAGGSNSTAAQVYTGPITLNTLLTVKVRVKSAGGEWSALTDAFFEPAAVAPSAANLVISEIMYNPPAPSAGEQTAGFTDPNDFEYARLTNIGSSPVDLSNLQLANAVTFNFSTGAVSAINPSASVLIVKNRDAFIARYGSSLNATIAGEFAGSLSNGGETLTVIVNSNAVTVRSVAYGDGPPWPEAADGYGPSLMLANPAAAPDHALPSSWIASAQPGGLPSGAPRTLSYNAWKLLSFGSGNAANAAISGPAADPDGDGVKNGGEYALGSAARLPDTAERGPITRIEEIGGQNYVTYEFTIQAGASEATATPEVSGDFVTWSSTAADIVTLSGPTNEPNGSIVKKVRDASPMTSAASRFIRLRLTAP